MRFSRMHSDKTNRLDADLNYDDEMRLAGQSICTRVLCGDRTAYLLIVRAFSRVFFTVFMGFGRGDESRALWDDASKRFAYAFLPCFVVRECFAHIACQHTETLRAFLFTFRI